MLFHRLESEKEKKIPSR